VQGVDRPSDLRKEQRCGIVIALERPSGPKAFLRNADLALHMARFPEAERRLLHKMICMQCYARNAMRATRCRKCGSTELRPKAKEARKE
jgi:large subunit ribosomal protein L40e